MTSRDERTTMDMNVGNSSSVTAESATASTSTTTAAATSGAQLMAAASGMVANSKLLLDKQKYIENYDFPYCEESNKYEPLKKIGQGTFGEVFKARDRQTHTKLVALKKVLMDNEKEGVSRDGAKN